MSQASQVNAGGDAAVRGHSAGEPVRQMIEQVSTLVRAAGPGGSGRSVKTGAEEITERA